nr:hypothetical protein [Pseudescherichia sp.]
MACYSIGSVFDVEKQHIIRIEIHKIIGGDFFESSTVFFDKTIFPIDIMNPIIVEDEKSIFIADSAFDNIVDDK